MKQTSGYIKKPSTSIGTSASHSFCAANIQTKLTVGSPQDSYEQEAGAVADKVMQAPAENFVQRKCAECEKEEKINRKPLSNSITPLIQTKSENSNSVSEGLSQSIQSSKGTGSSLDGNTQSFMSSRFGNDFSNVKIHTGNEAVEMNRGLSAKAFTVGNDIYFNEGQYQPNSYDGKHLLAHELVHTLQQTQNIGTKLIQRACHEEGNPSRTLTACAEGAQDVGRQPQGQSNTIDSRADAIIATAQGPGANSDKAMQVVNDIICSFMPGQASKVRKINYFSGEPGLNTQSVGSGASPRGDICVGDNFLTGTTRSGIARRVLQVAHELEHIDQYRAGLAGHNNRHLREFLAFYHEALANEFIGTRRMADNMRKSLIDGALGNYNCLSDTLKTEHQGKQQQLLTRRQTVNGTSGNAATNPPSVCAG